MENLVDEYGINGRITGLDLVRGIKLVQLEGFKVSSLWIETDMEMSYSDDSRETYLITLLRSMGFSISFDQANFDDGVLKGYDMPEELEEDNDENSEYISDAEVWVINHPIIDEYLQRAKVNGVKHDETIIFKNVGDIIPDDYSDFYEGFVQFSILAEDYSGICIIKNTDEFVSSYVIEEFIEIVKICKEDNLKYKEAGITK